MKRISVIGTIALFVVGTAVTIGASDERQRERGDGRTALIVTSSNRPNNELLVYDTTGVLVQTLPTNGQGGVGGNAGGTTAWDDTVAAVNFGSQSVSIFTRRHNGFVLTQIVGSVSPPVSVAFARHHVYILGTTTVESHAFDGETVDASPDGVVTLLRADGSAAQVGVAGDQLLISEKSGVVEVVDLRHGEVAGSATNVALPPTDRDTPFGLVTRGAAGYVTIAHSDEIALVRNGQLLALTAIGSGFPTGPGQQAPCWIANSGPYLFTSNSPSHTISRLVAARNSIIIDEPVAAHTNGAPIDIAAVRDLLAVVESDGGGQSHLTQFSVDGNGNLTRMASSAIHSAANGVAIVER
jgi:hypothetical protein